MSEYGVIDTVSFKNTFYGNDNDVEFRATVKLAFAQIHTETGPEVFDCYYPFENNVMYL